MLGLAIALSVALPGAARAQAQPAMSVPTAPVPAPPVPPPPAILEAISVAPGLWVVDETPAHGGAVTIFGGSQGVLLVDTGVESWTPALAATIARIAPGPVRIVITTHAHVDEIGGNAFFARAGAQLIGQEATRRAMIERKPPPPGADGRTARQARAFPPEAAPQTTFAGKAGEGAMDLPFNGQTVRLVAMPPAHTDNDTVVRFPRSDVIAVGDVLRAGEFPSINRADGGTLAGMVRALDRIIAMAGPKTWLITSHGQVVHREAAMAQRRLLLTARDRAARMIAAGRSLDEVLAADITRGLGAMAQPGHISAQQFVRDLYNELNAPG